MAGDYRQIARNMRTKAASGNFSGVHPSFMLYLGLMLIALLKDLLDLAGIGSLPGVGTVVTICFGFLIWILMTVFDRSGGKSNKKIARSLVFLFASLVEAIGFGLNFLPIETFTVLALYMMAKSAAKKEEKRLREEKTKENGDQEQQARRIQIQAARQVEQRIAAQEAESEVQPQLVAQSSDQSAPVQAPPRMMSDMKLPQNAVVTQGIQNPSQSKSRSVDASQFTGQSVSSEASVPRPISIITPSVSTAPAMSVGGRLPDEVSEGSIGVQNILQEEVTKETGGATGTAVEDAHFQQLELMRREKEVGAPLHREAREHRDKLLAGRGNFQLSKNDFDQHFSKGDFAVHEGLRQQNAGDCYAVAALHAFSQSPNFEMMVRSSTKRLPDGSWEVKIPLLDKNAETITVSPEEMQSQRNPGFLKRHGGVIADGILPDLRMKLDPVKASEGYRVLEAAYMKSKFGLNKINRLAAEGGQGEEFLLQLGGKENFLSYSLSSPKYDSVEKKWKYPGLSSLPEEKMSYLDHLLETFDPDVFVATANTKFLDKTKLSNKVLDALGLPFYKATGANKMFVAGHAYSLTKVDKEKKMVTLANPWNTKKPIELTIQQFKETFSEVSAVRIYHGKLLENMKSLHPNE